MTKRRLIRPGDQLTDADTVVVRGGTLDPGAMRADAQRHHDIYGTYGISVFAARDTAVDELAQQPPLVRFSMLTLVRVGALRQAGLQLEATGRNPRHFTVAFDDLAVGLSALLGCDHVTWINPYHED
jgi:hypothetical protein